MKKLLIITALVCFFSVSGLQAQTEELKVTAAILNYVEALYEVKPELIKESVHPDLNKIGYYRPADADDYQEGSPMTYDQLYNLAAKWNAKGNLPEDAPKAIKIFEVQDKTATAKLTAQWGTDYFHLAKLDGKWMIINVIWQSPPKMNEVQANEGN